MQSKPCATARSRDAPPRQLCTSEVRGSSAWAISSQPDQRLAALEQQIRKAHVEQVLQCVDVGDAALAHEPLHRLALRPPLRIHLVAADVNAAIGKHPRDIVEQPRERRVHVLVGRVEAGRVHAETIRRRKRLVCSAPFRMRGEPARRVPRHVDLGHHADPEFGRVVDDTAEVFFGIKAPAAAEPRQFREALCLEPKRLVVAQVQMQHVELEQCHCVQRAQQRRHFDEMACDVDHQAAPRKTRRVVDQYARERATGCTELRECRETAQHPPLGRRRHPDFRAVDRQYVRLVVAEFGKHGGSDAAIDGDRRTSSADFRHSLRTADRPRARAATYARAPNRSWAARSSAATAQRCALRGAATAAMPEKRYSRQRSSRAIGLGGVGGPARLSVTARGLVNVGALLTPCLRLSHCDLK